jgi:hypothetical protein
MMGNPEVECQLARTGVGVEKGTAETQAGRGFGLDHDD